jgi:hypothetical protein
MTSDVGHSSALLETLGDPGLDVSPAEAEVFAYPEASGAGVVVSPGVDGLHRDLEIVGQLLDRQ